MTSVITNRDRDCLACRLVSGSGLIGIGGYLGYHGKRNPTIPGKVTIFSLALIFASLGVARCGQLYPFDKSTRKTENSTEVV